MMKKRQTIKLSPLVLLLPLVYGGIPLVYAFTHQSTPLTRSNNNEVSSADDGGYFKRFLIASSLALIPFLGWDAHEPSIIPHANALKEKNEVLCNTGFFTNVGAWYCTDIGNIGDEGKPKQLSSEAEASVDSLMSKFNLDGDFSDGTGTSGNNGKQSGNTSDKDNSDKTKN